MKKPKFYSEFFIREWNAQEEYNITKLITESDEYHYSIEQRGDGKNKQLITKITLIRNEPQ